MSPGGAAFQCSNTGFCDGPQLAGCGKLRYRGGAGRGSTPARSTRPPTSTVERSDPPLVIADVIRPGGSLSLPLPCRTTHVEMIPVRWIEPPAPPPAESFPLEPNQGPDARIGKRGWRVTHAQVSRHSRTLKMPALRCRRLIRIERREHRTRPSTGNDPEARPTCPLGGHAFTDTGFQSEEHTCHSRRDSPSSRQLTPITLEALTPHSPGGVTPAGISRPRIP